MLRFISRRFSKALSKPEGGQLDLQRERESELDISIPRTTFSPRYRTGQTERAMSSKVNKYFLEHFEGAQRRLLDGGATVRPGGAEIGDITNKIYKDIEFKFRHMMGDPVDIGWNLNLFSFETAGLPKEDLMKTLSDMTRNYLAELVRWGVRVAPDGVSLTHSPAYISFIYDLFDVLFKEGRIYTRSSFHYFSVAKKSFLSEREIEMVDERTQGYTIPFRLVCEEEPGLKKAINSGEVYLLVSVQEPLSLVCGKRVFVQEAESMLLVEHNGRLLVTTANFLNSRKIFRDTRYTVLGKYTGAQLGGCSIENPFASSVSGLVPVELQTGRVHETGAELVSPELSQSQFQKVSELELDFDPSFVGDKVSRGVYRGMKIASAEHLAEQHLQKSQLAVPLYTPKVDKAVDRSTKDRLFILAQNNLFLRVEPHEREAVAELWAGLPKVGPSHGEGYSSVEDRLLRIQVQDILVSSEEAFGLPVPLLRESKRPGNLKYDEQFAQKLRQNISSTPFTEWQRISLAQLEPNSPRGVDRDRRVFDFQFLKAANFAFVGHRPLQTDPRLHDSAFSGTQPEAEETEQSSRSRIEAMLSELVDYELIEGLDQNESLLWKTLCLQYILAGKLFVSSAKSHRLLYLHDNPHMKAVDILEGTEHTQGRMHPVGADAFRLFLASHDHVSSDTPAEFELTTAGVNNKKAEINLLRKVFWSALRLVNDQTDHVDIRAFGDQTDRLSKSVLASLNFLRGQMLRAYTAKNYAQVYRLLMDFVKYTLGDIYIPFVQDSFVLDRYSKTTLVGTNVLRLALDELVVLMAPILPFNAEDIYSNFTHRQIVGSVFEEKLELPSSENQRIPRLELADFEFLENLSRLRSRVHDAKAAHFNDRRVPKGGFLLQVLPYSKHKRIHPDDLTGYKALFAHGREEMREVLGLSEISIHEETESSLAQPNPSDFTTIPIERVQLSINGKPTFVGLKLFRDNSSQLCERCLKFAQLEEGICFCPECITKIETAEKRAQLAKEKSTKEN